jgi:hypothetical protein
MSRHEKLKKLGHAIREYRGVFHRKTGKWKQPPNPGARDRVVAWLERIGQTPDQVEISLKAIDGFQSIPEFQTWIQRQ